VTVALLAGACGRSPFPQRSPPAPATATAPANASAPGAVRTAEPTASAHDRPLLLWTVPQLSPDAPGGGALAQILTAFRTAYPDLGLEVAVKPAYGPTGITVFLASTKRVLPDQMPDVAILPLSAVRSASTQGLLQEIPATVAQDRWSSAFGFARQQTRPDDRAWAVPLAVDAAHVVARGDALPSTWSDLMAAGPFGIYFSDADVSGLAAILALYASAGGRLDELPAAQPTPAAAMLAMLAEASQHGALATPVAGQSAAESWQDFVDGKTNVALVSGGTVIGRMGAQSGVIWGPLPGAAGPAGPIGWGWAIVVTSTGVQRSASARLVNWLTSPENRGWVLEHGYLPAWRDDWLQQAAALPTPPPQRYAEFLAQQLEDAVSVDQPDNWSAEWVGAADDVILGEPVGQALATIAP
jgi:ABC-type glycerol-3-phosphate transport system substrate-binding protein